MFETAKRREDPKDWTIIYEKLSIFQNELKQSEHYMVICEFMLQQQIFSAKEDNVQKIENLKRALKNKQSEIDEKNYEIENLTTKFRETMTEFENK